MELVSIITLFLVHYTVYFVTNTFATKVISNTLFVSSTMGCGVRFCDHTCYIFYLLMFASVRSRYFLLTCSES